MLFHEEHQGHEVEKAKPFSCLRGVFWHLSAVSGGDMFLVGLPRRTRGRRQGFEFEKSR